MPFGCNSDHSDEQRIFDMSAERQMSACVRFKNVGNMLFREGQYERAREKYRKAIVYYEYAFPEEEALQEKMDNVRFLCLLNMAACQLKLRQLREALSSLNQALHARPNSAKALYRRAQVWRHLDEFQAAGQDLLAAHKLAPTSPDIKREALALANQRKAYVRKAREMAQAMLGSEGAAQQPSAPHAESALTAAGRPDISSDWASVTTAGSEVDLESTAGDGVSLGDGDWDAAAEDSGEEGGVYLSTDQLLRSSTGSTPPAR